MKTTECLPFCVHNVWAPFVDAILTPTSHLDDDAYLPTGVEAGTGAARVVVVVDVVVTIVIMVGAVTVMIVRNKNVPPLLKSHTPRTSVNMTC